MIFLSAGGLRVTAQHGQGARFLPPCEIPSLVVFLQGTSTGIPEGLVVKDSGNEGYSTLRNVIACAKDGDVITYDQSAPIPVTMTTLTGTLEINKSLTFMGLNIDNRPEIKIDFTSIGDDHGILISSDKTVILKDIDLRTVNNPTDKDIIRVMDTSMLKVTGKTVVSKD